MADPDQNGAVNLLEYALDAPAPSSAMNVLMPIAATYHYGVDRWATLDWRQMIGAGDLNYQIEYSYDLSSWKSVPIDGLNFIETVIHEDIDGDGSARLNQTRVKTNSDESFFYRLKVIQNIPDSP